MNVLRLVAITTLTVSLMLITGGSFYGQPAAGPGGDDGGFTLYESFRGSSNSLGQVTQLNTAIGYKFNRYFSVDAGLPVYFIRASDTSVLNGAKSGNGVGNVFADLYLTLNNPVLTYESRLTGTAPTGDKDLGLTTGRATIDWNNYFGRDIGRVRPFANIGLANTVSDTPYFVRPFSTLGTVGHFEGGASLRVFPFVRVGASLYDILPTGTQKVYSRLVPRGSSSVGAQIAALRALQSTGPGSGQGSGSGSQGGVDAGAGNRTSFESQSLTVGSSDLTRDNGYSGWLNISPVRNVFLQAGYTRSVVYRLDTFWFGVGFNFNLPGIR